jgi:hypothetical protein
VRQVGYLQRLRNYILGLGLATLRCVTWVWEMGRRILKSLVYLISWFWQVLDTLADTGILSAHCYHNYRHKRWFKCRRRFVLLLCFKYFILFCYKLRPKAAYRYWHMYLRHIQTIVSDERWGNKLGKPYQIWTVDPFFGIFRWGIVRSYLHKLTVEFGFSYFLLWILF